MFFSSFSVPTLFQASLRRTFSLAFLSAAVSLTTNEPFLSKPPAEWTEAEALQVLNVSPWAHRVEASLQATPCDHEHPCFPRMYPEGSGAALGFELSATCGGAC